MECALCPRRRAGPVGDDPVRSAVELRSRETALLVRRRAAKVRIELD
jgi:hypothetical protein